MAATFEALSRINELLSLQVPVPQLPSELNGEIRDYFYAVAGGIAELAAKGLDTEKQIGESRLRQVNLGKTYILALVDSPADWSVE